MAETPTFQIAAELGADHLEQLLPGIVGRALPAFIGAQRWYGDKARDLSQIDIAASSVVRHDRGYLVLLNVTVAFSQGASAEYFVPLSVLPAGDPEVGIIGTIEGDGERWIVFDAVQTAGFRRWLLEELNRQGSDPTSRFRWTTTSAASDPLPAAMRAESRLSSAQQSNSSIVYGNSVILKIFRRLSPGVNPEVELGRFLTTRTSFRNIPLLLGEWGYTAADGSSRSLAVAQSFIPSVGDGWSHTLNALNSPAAATDADARRLGQLTAQLHLALASARSDDDLSPEPIRTEDAASWSERVNEAVTWTAQALRHVAGNHSGETRELIEAFLGLAPRLTAQASGFERLVGRQKTRVHGDYHLGQTLRTTGGDFVILDFEGEPQRPIEERRAKTSPLKDVAGMLRSFGYARGAAEREAAAGTSPAEVVRSDLVAWERTTRRAYVESYVAESRRGGAKYLPPSDDDIRQALAAWELDKALYEVNYELNNRPDWLALPLAATLKLA